MSRLKNKKVKEIIKGFEKKELFWEDLPTLLIMDICPCIGIVDLLVNKNVPYPIETFQITPENYMIQTKKLIATSFRKTSYLSVSIVHTKYFKSRKSLHKSFLIVAEYPSYTEIYKNYGKISARDAFTLLKTNMRCNMDYYLANTAELESDLQRKIDFKLLKDNSFLMGLEEELFNKQMAKNFW